MVRFGNRIIWGFLICSGLSFPLSSPVDTFKKNLKTYDVHPSWVLVDFLQMDLESFVESAQLLATTLQNYPAFYLGMSEEQYAKKDYSDLLLEHCKAYQEFFDGVYINPLDRSLVLLKPQATASDRKKYVGFLEFAYNQKLNCIADICALGFDIVSKKFVSEIVLAHKCMSDDQAYRSSVKKIMELRSAVFPFYSRIRGTKYEARYSQHIKRYIELFDLLRKEKKAQSDV